MISFFAGQTAGRFFTLSMALSAAALLVVAAPERAHAAQCSEADAAGLVQGLVSDALRIVSSAGRKDGTEAAGEGAVAGVIDQTFSLDQMADFAIGAHGRTADPASMEAYRAAFADYFVRRYGDDIGALAGGSLTLGALRSRGDGEFLIRTDVTTREGEAVPIQWRVRCDAGGQPRIVDFAARGVSAVLMMRGEFSEVAEHGGIEQVTRMIAR